MTQIALKLGTACLQVIAGMVVVALCSILLVRVALAQPTPAQAPVTFTLSSDDQGNFREICRYAMQNTALATQVIYQISAWCLTKENEIRQAVAKPKEETK